MENTNRLYPCVNAFPKKFPVFFHIPVEAYPRAPTAAGFRSHPYDMAPAARVLAVLTSPLLPLSPPLGGCPEEALLQRRHAAVAQKLLATMTREYFNHQKLMGMLL